MFVRVVIPGYFDERYIVPGGFSKGIPLDIPKENILIDHKPSLVALDSSKASVIKIVKARSWHEYFKHLWQHSRIHKEVKGNYLMSRLGFRVPQIYSIGYRIFPDLRNASLGFYQMENMSLSGFRTVRDLFDNGEIILDQRESVLKTILDGLSVLMRNRIVFTDFHLENVMMNEQGELVWMDTGVTTFSVFSGKKFIRKHNHALDRLATYYSENYFTEQEKEQIRALKL